MYYAVGERIHAPKKPDHVIATCRETWSKHGLRAMLSLRGMLYGPTRNRLEKVMGVTNLEFVVNLLPPDNKCGTWNRGQAVANADILKPWLSSQKAQGVFLLGTKVMQAVTRDRTFRFFDVYWVDDVPCLCLPHPSGRGRWLSDPDRARQCREEVSRFYAATVAEAASV